MRRHGRLVGGVYAAAAGVLIIAVLAVAYGTAAPSLGIAEFAPTANEAIEPPPTTTGSDTPLAGRGARRGTTTTAPLAATGSTADPTSASAAPPTTQVGRARGCFGNPPRQSEDPMSPSCLATVFEGDNGGATSTGVSATEIRVAVPGPSGGGAVGSTNFKPTVTALLEHFNRRFELYGRRLVPVYVEGSAADAALARALGATIGSQQVFATATGFLESEASNYGTAVQVGLLHELARQRVVTATRNAGTGWSDKGVFDVFHPYLWGVYPSAETNYDNLVDFICSTMIDRPARHATEVGLRSKTRQFGVVAVGQQTAPNVSRIVDGLRACGEEPSVFQSGTGANANDLRAGMERLRAAGATSIINVSEGRFGYEHALPAAKGMGFEPEWVVLPYALVTNELIPQFSSYKASYIRLESGPRLLPLQARPWFGALLEGGSQIMQGSAGDRQGGFYAGQSLYEGLLLLASGIQAAGPALTPDTFAQGLMSTAFPNPGAGAAPYWQPSAGFGPGDHAFYDDFAVAWWSDTAPAVEAYSGPQGSWCYLGGGARFRLGSYPADADAQLYSASEPCR